jgi:hypothetical protein
MLSTPLRRSARLAEKRKTATSSCNPVADSAPLRHSTRIVEKRKEATAGRNPVADYLITLSSKPKLEVTEDRYLARSFSDAISILNKSNALLNTAITEIRSITDTTLRRTILNNAHYNNAIDIIQTIRFTSDIHDTVYIYVVRGCITEMIDIHHAILEYHGYSDLSIKQKQASLVCMIMHICNRINQLNELFLNSGKK